MNGQSLDAIATMSSILTQGIQVMNTQKPLALAARHPCHRLTEHSKVYLPVADSQWQNISDRLSQWQNPTGRIPLAESQWQNPNGRFPAINTTWRSEPATLSQRFPIMLLFVGIDEPSTMVPVVFDGGIVRPTNPTRQPGDHLNGWYSSLISIKQQTPLPPL